MTPATQTGFLDRQLSLGSRSFPYVIYVPREYDPRHRWPAILFLHGAGERGTDGLRQTEVGIGSAIRFEPARVPAIVVFPQAPPDERWIGDPAAAAIEALDAASREFNIDRDRVYLTGLSMGGYGAWHVAMTEPDRFAAAVVICGGVLPHESAKSVRQSPLTVGAPDPHSETAARVRGLPLWIVHGTADTVVPVDESRRMVKALRDMTAPEVAISSFLESGTTPGTPRTATRSCGRGCSHRNARHVECERLRTGTRHSSQSARFTSVR